MCCTYKLVAKVDIFCCFLQCGLFFCNLLNIRTNEAKRGLMKPPIPKSLNILYFILTFTSEIFIYSLKFKTLWM